MNKAALQPFPAVYRLVTWTERHISARARQSSGKTTVQQLLWFAAYQDACMLLEDTPRHVAQSLQEGMGPYKEPVHLEAWLVGQEDDETLHEQLRQFWHIQKEDER